MFCKRCRYSLKDLESWRCPECGRAFNPHDRTTFRLTAKSRIGSPAGIALRVGIAAVGLATWYWMTMGDASGNTSWEHHANAGAFIIVKESDSEIDYAIGLVLWGLILAPGIYWTVTAKLWAALTAVLFCVMSVGMSRQLAAWASC